MVAGCLVLASAAFAQQRATSPVITDSGHVVGTLAREPMIAELPNGALFVSGYSDTTPKLWKSSDRGATWARVNVGTAADGAIGNSDPGDAYRNGRQP